MVTYLFDECGGVLEVSYSMQRQHQTRICRGHQDRTQWQVQGYYARLCAGDWSENNPPLINIKRKQAT